MKKSLLKLFGVAAITWSAQVSAAGIGGINVISALGDPLKADIDLVSVSNDEKSSLVARLASPEAYKTAGLDYPFTNKFKLTIETRADGTMFIRAVSTQPVNDPFVSLLVELSWASGRVSREYTFLLDPTGYQAEQPVVASVQPVAPAAAPVSAPVVTKPASSEAAVSSHTESSDPQVAVNSQQLDSENPVKSHGSKMSQKRAVTAAPAADETGDVAVQKGDTLSKIAAANKVDGVSLERMMVAFYRANADQFEGRNLNRIKTGKILRKPDAAEIAALSQADAKSEIHAQVNDWNAYRQKVASLVTTNPVLSQSSTQQVSSGKVSSSVADKAPVAKETAKEVLKLSKGDSPSDKVAGGQATKQEKKNAVQEDAVAKAKAAEEERTRTALLEKNLQDIKHLAELKTQAAALAQAASTPKAVVVASQVAAVSQPVAASAVASAVNAVSAVASASAVVPLVKPAPKPVAKPQPTMVEESFIDQLLAQPTVLGGGLAALFGIGGLGFAMLRRKRQAQPQVESSFTDTLGATTSRITAPVVPSPETGDFTAHPTTTQSLAPMSVEDDPISEAELFLSFGRDAQAEEILQEALQTVADKTPIKLKLLEIYVGRKDSASFASIASQIKASGDVKAWKKVEAMGLKLDPHNPLYGGVAQVEASDSATMQMQTVILDTPPSVSDKSGNHFSANAVAAPVAVEEDLSALLFADTQVKAKSSVMDFDVTAGHSSMGAEVSTSAAPSFDDLVFDVTATHPPMNAMAATPTEAKEPAGNDLPFTMDFALDSGDATTNLLAKASEFNFSDINLNLSTDQPDTGAKAGTDHWHEVSTKLDLARVYHEMGDAAGAKDILTEVLQEGDAAQRAAAQDILKQLS